MEVLIEYLQTASNLDMVEHDSCIEGGQNSSGRVEVRSENSPSETKRAPFGCFAPEMLAVPGWAEAQPGARSSPSTSVRGNLPPAISPTSQHLQQALPRGQHCS